MTGPAKRERAALEVVALLPDRWAVWPTSYDPGTGRWTWTAAFGSPTSRPGTSPPAWGINFERRSATG